MTRLIVASTLTLGLSLAPVGPVAADEVLFLNGDRLSGKVLSATDGKPRSRPREPATSRSSSPR